jgi:hypothetical protein
MGRIDKWAAAIAGMSNVALVGLCTCSPYDKSASGAVAKENAVQRWLNGIFRDDAVKAHRDAVISCRS